MNKTDDKKLDIYRKLKNDFTFFAEKALVIRSEAGGIVPFKLNESQVYVHKKIEEIRRNKGKVRVIILKARQQGFSTYIAGRFYWRVTHEKGYRCFILSHEEQASANLFDMVKRYHDNTYKDLKPSTGSSSAKELYFDKLDSGYKVGTAGNKATGRSSTIQLFHGSEVGFWPNDREHAAGILQAIPDEPGTEVILESTANGLANLFYELSMKAIDGQSDYELIFVPWFMSVKYQSSPPDDFAILDEEEQRLVDNHKLSNAQLHWRRKKYAELGEFRFKQEYPATIQEAFQTSGDDAYIKPGTVIDAMNRITPGYGPILLGVDPAGGGKDQTAFVWRQGMKVLDYNLRNIDTMECVGICIHQLTTGSADFVCVDANGLGAGVYDRLKELGYSSRVIQVIGSRKPDDDRLYKNKRVECWGRMKEWLKTGSLPNDDKWLIDLTKITWKYDSSGREALESKQDMRSRGISSPDLADALSNTFNSKINRDRQSSLNNVRVVKADYSR